MGELLKSVWTLDVTCSDYTYTKPTNPPQAPLPLFPVFPQLFSKYTRVNHSFAEYHQHALHYSSAIKQCHWCQILQGRCSCYSAYVSSSVAFTLLVGQREGHPACKKTEWWVLAMPTWHGYLSGARCRLAYGPADVTEYSCFSLVLPFWYQLTRVVQNKGLLNGCSK